MITFTTAEVAEHLRCGPRKVRKVAKANGLGINLEGKAGYRYTQADVDALWEAMRPQQPVVAKRRKRP